MQKIELVSRYEQAAAILPSRLRKAALAISDEEKAVAEELRLPVIVHDRDAHKDCLDMVRAF